ncbi:YafY family protein [Paenibacillus sp.]|jgi:predicted DNA-binding transcriptional regulator YafY|uniref:helix-turn-helix transcriptional regulator n=1 Tax=Paenibacillus sp. TaxID=58172 RepID=UPI0028189D6C|nr:YafY family protein [Paenibacillus sp.]MDR0269522.1 YafY family transcriptional regulator [Paenibacillus sp.]
MSKTKLLFDLIMYVNSKRNFTAQDVADEFRVSVRTAHRYLMEISELGVPIYTEQGRNGGYRTLKNRVLPPVLFDENEALSIFFAFRSLAFYESLPFDTDIESASRKLLATLPEDTKRKINQLKTVLSFWNPKRGVSAPYLKELIEAAAESCIVRMEYQSKSGNKTKNAVPIGVYANDGLWYMPALDLEKRKIQLFRVDRILALIVTEQTCEVETGLMEWLQRYTVTSPVRLLVELTLEGVRECQSKPWYNPILLDNERENGIVGIIDTVIDRNEIAFTAAYFAQLGKAAKVHEPQEMIDQIRSHAQSLLDHYQ